jgi:hypothetical protein
MLLPGRYKVALLLYNKHTIIRHINVMREEALYGASTHA